MAWTRRCSFFTARATSNKGNLTDLTSLDTSVNNTIYILFPRLPVLSLDVYRFSSPREVLEKARSPTGLLTVQMLGCVASGDAEWVKTHCKMCEYETNVSKATDWCFIAPMIMVMLRMVFYCFASIMLDAHDLNKDSSLVLTNYMRGKVAMSLEWCLSQTSFRSVTHCNCSATAPC